MMNNTPYGIYRLTEYQQRGWLTTADHNGNLTEHYGWFMVTGFDNIAKRKIGGRNWVYYGKTSSIVSFIADTKAGKR